MRELGLLFEICAVGAHLSFICLLLEHLLSSHEVVGGYILFVKVVMLVLSYDSHPLGQRQLTDL